MKGRTISRRWMESINEIGHGNVGWVEVAQVGCWILET